MKAASKGLTQTVALLISHGADVNPEVRLKLAVERQPTGLVVTARDKDWQHMHQFHLFSDAADPVTCTIFKVLLPLHLCTQSM